MPLVKHVEKHFQGSEFVRDIVIGMSDGLTVPFALAAGLSGAVIASKIVVTAGLAEVAAGSIAMGLGGYLAAQGDREHYDLERAREVCETIEVPDKEVQEVVDVLTSYGLSLQEAQSIAASIAKRPKDWVDFMMRFELGLEEPDPKRALKSALTIGGSYVVGGLVPLAPYFFVATPTQGLPISAIVTLFALLMFGYFKGRAAGVHALRSAIQTAFIGGLAACAAFALAKAIS